jgi:hypothetical protein
MENQCPAIRETEHAKTLLGSVINAFDDVVGGDCVAAYAGRIRHPAKK